MGPAYLSRSKAAVQGVATEPSVSIRAALPGGLPRVTNLASLEPLLQELFSLGFTNPLVPGGDRALRVSFHLEISAVLGCPLFPRESHVCVSAARNLPAQPSFQFTGGQRETEKSVQAGESDRLLGDSTKWESQASFGTFEDKAAEVLGGKSPAQGSWDR